MLNQITTAMRKVASQSAQKTIAHSISMRDTTSRMIAAAKHGLMVFGLIALATLTLIFFKPEVADQLQALSPFTQAVASTAPSADIPPMANLMDEPAGTDTDDVVPTASAAPSPMLGTDIQQKRVTEWLSKRYRVAGDATNMLVSAAYLTAKEINLDPLLILAVMAIESRFNPFAESPVGAQGLMQVMSKVHHDKFAEMGGAQAALNPVANIRVGSLILKEYVSRGGSVEAGLKRYVGAAEMETDAGYGAKVLGEYDRLKAVANGKRVSVYASMASRSAPKVQPIPDPLDRTKSAAGLINAKTAMEDQIKPENADKVTAL
ncbi:MAG TPA: lytic transglycosylase domain-containing protein [Oxalicibacterium sp.]|uniref:lytic transglycosylase domain-containing protein n=1 Tax=Oxalicibacterium sp. TaxID=2766525 RepID=UPI002B5C47B9|nr:lytic transglycosylase domain-containing protein [Oxalicibacterium sp.]HWU99429.1 lytic transglycosylase domain-containing protein [Oxalicibacterium sp.]